MPLVVIDPGHGGRDPGTSGNGYQEKTLVLSTAMMLRDALRRCGVNVLMTRETDTLPLPSGTIGQDLAYRADLANRNNADLFVSWHIDSAANATVSGVAVWIYPATRGTRTESWAQRISGAIATNTGQRNRGVYLGDFQVLRETEMDAVLVEAGFITNAQEANNLANTEFQRAQAEGAARAICDLFDLPYVAPVRPDPTPRPTTPPPATEQPPAQNRPEEWPDWAEDAIRTMMEWGVMTGYPDGSWRPDQNVTRAELAVALTRFYNFIRGRNGGV